MRMPRFNMSPDEATALVNYFAARDNATYPYEYLERKSPERIEQLETELENLKGSDKEAEATLPATVDTPGGRAAA